MTTRNLTPMTIKCYTGQDVPVVYWQEGGPEFFVWVSDVVKHVGGCKMRVYEATTCPFFGDVLLVLMDGSGYIHPDNAVSPADLTATVSK